VSETVVAARLLRQLRKDQGRSLREVADELGVAPSHLSRLERGEKSPSGELIQRAARYYGLDDEIVGLASGRVPADVVEILRRFPELLGELRDRFGGVQS
jgi:transcriptional regulator with XRE-family HTH domain